MLIDPDPEENRRKQLQEALPGQGPAIMHRMTAPLPEGVCGRCTAFSEGRCRERDMLSLSAIRGVWRL
ncbi:MAG: hypothetical protein MZV65_32045 [Chromatiales bacterium]|nr:hypothetical protein [Chromatiales bacterium]